jgi:hypothetical protein
MASSPPANLRDDDPVHANLDGIRFQATTDKSGVICVPCHAQAMPPVSFMPANVAIVIAADTAELIGRIRKADPASYLATFLDGMLDDLSTAIEACRPAVTN